MPRFKCLPYRPPSPEEQPKAGPGEDEKTRRTREPDFPTRATRVYASVEEAERARGHLPEVYGTSEWADQFHFPRRTQPVGRGRFTLPTAHDSAPRPGGSFGAHALGKNEKRQSITKKKPKKQSAPRVVKLDLTRVDDDTPVTIDGSSSSSSEDVDDRVAPTDSEENSSWAEAFSDEPRWGEDDDATWHPALEGRKRRDERRKSRASEPVKRVRRTKRRRVEPPTLTSSPMKHARDVDRFLFRRGAARAMGSVMAREAPRAFTKEDDEGSSSGGGGDDDDDTDGGDDDDDDASLPLSTSGDVNTYGGDEDRDSSSSSSFSSSSSAPAPGPSIP